MISLDFSAGILKLRQSTGKVQVFDPVRKKWIILTPEEHVRQYLLQYLCGVMDYPAALIAVEKSISVGPVSKRFDIVVYDRDHRPWMLVECKSPEVPVSQKTLEQLLQYQRTVQSRYWLLSNGVDTYCADATDVRQIRWMDSLPLYEL